MCLRRSRVLRRYQEAEIPTQMWTLTWREWLDRYQVAGAAGILKAARELRAGRAHGSFLFRGKPSRAKRAGAALVLKDACRGGLTARSVKVSDLVDVEFGRGELDVSVYRVPVLVVEAGLELPHKLNRVVLEKVIRRLDVNQFTALVVEVDLDRFMTQYKSTEIEDAAGGMKQVWIRGEFAGPQTQGKT